jgi:hypothetical protein
MLNHHKKGDGGFISHFRAVSFCVCPILCFSLQCSSPASLAPLQPSRPDWGANHSSGPTWPIFIRWPTAHWSNKKEQKRPMGKFTAWEDRNEGNKKKNDKKIGWRGEGGNGNQPFLWLFSILIGFN